MNDLTYAEEAVSLKVTNQGSYDNAASAIVAVKRDITRIEAERDAELRPVLREEDEIRARYAGDLELLAESEAHLRKQMTRHFDAAQANEQPVRRAANTTMQTRWKAEVTDFGALVQFAYQHEAERLELLKPDQAALTALARKDKDDFNIPGVKAIKSTSLGVGRH